MKASERGSGLPKVKVLACRLALARQRVRWKRTQLGRWRRSCRRPACRLYLAGARVLERALPAWTAVSKRLGLISDSLATQLGKSGMTEVRVGPQ